MTGITSIEFNNNFDTSNVRNMANMFRECQSLKRIDFSSFDTSNVTNMSSLFSNWNSETNSFRASSLEEIIFGENFDTSKVTTMNDMFSGCVELNILDVSMFDTSNVTDMYHMFNYCSLIELNLCSFNTRKVINAIGMFADTHNLNNVYVGENFDLSGADTTMIFYNSNISSATTGQCPR